MIDNEEMFNTIEPEAKECKDCIYALGAVYFDGQRFERYAFGRCGKYEIKPNEILWDGAKCPVKEAVHNGDAIHRG